MSKKIYSKGKIHYYKNDDGSKVYLPKYKNPAKPKGGKFGGAGAGDTWEDLEDSYDYVLDKDTLLIPIQRNFSDAFKTHREKNDSVFTFDGKLYSTKLSDTPIDENIGINRVETTYVPIVTEKKRKIKTNQYSLGSILNNAYSKLNPKEGNNIFGLTSGGTELASGIGQGLSFGIDALSGGNSNTTGNVIKGLGSVASMIPGVGSLVGAGLNVLGSGINAFWGNNINENAVHNIENNIKNVAGFKSNAQDYTSLLSDINNRTTLYNFKDSELGTQGIFSNKRDRIANNLRQEGLEAEEMQYAGITNAADNVSKNILSRLQQENFAYGGPFNMNYTGVMSPFGNQFADGGIHIKPSHRGRLTELKARTGKTESELYNDGNPAHKKMVVFARNARKWKHEDGGPIFNEFNNDVTQINAGGSHESNPLEGVQVGVDPQGVPNLVEEGEVIFNNYVFSDRLNVPKAVRQKYKLRGTTFAECAKELQKESEERPNDPISKKGLYNSMEILINEQENIRARKEANKYAKGGRIANKYDEGDYINIDGIFDFTPNALLNKYLIDKTTSAYNPIAYIPEVPYDKKYNNNSSTTKIKPIQDNIYRKAPIFGHALAVANDLFGGNKPDYSTADRLEQLGNNAFNPVRARYIGDYLTYNPFDTDYALNKLNAQYAGTRRALANTSGGNRATAMAGILASDYNLGNAIGDTLIKAAEYNSAQKKAVADFNRATNIQNATMGTTVDQFNAEGRLKVLPYLEKAALTRQAITDANRAEKSANLTSLLDSISGYGQEMYNTDMIRWLAEKGVIKAACGGKIRRKKGVTI